MKQLIAVVYILSGILLVTSFGQNETAKSSKLRLMLSEVQAGTMASQQHCMLVFDDRRFHAETASLKMGKYRERKVYEGELSETDWNAVNEIIDSKRFRELKMTAEIAPLVLEDVHSYNIAVAREKGYQNLEFLTKKSRKQYESQLRPLLDWWKSHRNERSTQSAAAPDDRCTLDSTQPLFSN